MTKIPTPCFKHFFSSFCLCWWHFSPVLSVFLCSLSLSLSLFFFCPHHFLHLHFFANFKSWSTAFSPATFSAVTNCLRNNMCASDLWGGVIYNENRGNFSISLSFVPGTWKSTLPVSKQIVSLQPRKWTGRQTHKTHINQDCEFVWCADCWVCVLRLSFVIWNWNRANHSQSVAIMWLRSFADIWRRSFLSWKKRHQQWPPTCRLSGLLVTGTPKFRFCWYSCWRVKHRWFVLICFGSTWWWV